MGLLSKSDKAIIELLRTYDFWDRIDKMSIPEPNSGCILWLGAVNHKGYAVINRNQMPVKISRAVLAYRIKRLPFMALHTCDVKCCINGDHLYEGTDKDNVRDALNRGQFTRGKNGRFT